MDNRVYVVKCGEYAQTENKMNELLEMMGGMNRFVRKGEDIALKVNLLREARPDEAVSTHPAVVAAVARMVMKEKAKPLIVDSPGSGFRYTKAVLEKIYHTNGMWQAAEDSGAELNFDTSFEKLSFPEGELIKWFEVITPVLKADGMLNLCKLKTHSFTHMTGAVKNHFGVIPGRTKPGYHAKLADKNLFVDMLLDLMHAVPSRISIMDAVVAMEGDGPGTGDPKEGRPDPGRRKCPGTGCGGRRNHGIGSKKQPLPGSGRKTRHPSPPDRADRTDRRSFVHIESP